MLKTCRENYQQLVPSLGSNVEIEMSSLNLDKSNLLDKNVESFLSNFNQRKLEVQPQQAKLQATVFKILLSNFK